MLTEFPLLLPSILFLGLMLGLVKLSRRQGMQAIRKRIASLQGRRNALQRSGKAKENLPKIQQHKTSNFLTSFKKYKIRLMANYKTQFERCGWSPQYAYILVPTLQTLFILYIFGAFLLLALYVPAIEELPMLYKGVLGFFLCLLGIQGVNYIFMVIIILRYKKLRKHISMVIDLLVICVRSGISVDKSLDYIAEEIITVNPDLAKELAITSAELTILPNRRIAYENFARRVNLDSIKTFTSSLIQAEEQGVSISNTLKVLSQDFMKKSLLKIEGKAAKLPVLLTLPVIFLGLPALMIIILGPVVVQVLDNFG